eukprot:COSAG01_NODE_5798_length_4029_cov_6.905344_1_plen_537_part_00
MPLLPPVAQRSAAAQHAFSASVARRPTTGGGGAAAADDDDESVEVGAAGAQQQMNQSLETSAQREDDIESVVRPLLGGGREGSTAAPGQAGDAPAAAAHTEEQQHDTTLIETMVARGIRSPANLHQVTAMLCREEDTPLPTKLTYMVGSWLVVMIQLIVLTSAGFAATFPSCSDNTQCSAGKFCTDRGNLFQQVTPDAPTVQFQGSRCMWCNSVNWFGGSTLNSDDDMVAYITAGGSLTALEARQWVAERPLTPQTSWRSPNATAFCTAVPTHPACNVTDHPWEGGCWDPARPTDAWIGDSFEDDTQKALAAMKPTDWVAFVFASCVSALFVAAEVQDIKMCQALAHGSKTHGLSVWEWMIWALTAARQFAVLPAFVAALPVLVLILGSDTLSLCFNVVALLFVLEADNMLFAQWLPPGVCERVLEQRTQLSHTDEAAFLTSRRAHVVAIPLGAVGCLASIRSSPFLLQLWPVAALIPLYLFVQWIPAFAEILVRMPARMRGGDDGRPCHHVLSGTFILWLFAVVLLLAMFVYVGA